MYGGCLFCPLYPLLKYLNEKLDQCKDMFRGVLLLKNKSRKRSQKQTKRKSKKRKQHGGSKNFKLLHQLLSADLNSDVIDIDNVNVESLARLSVRQVRWLTKMAKNGHLTERAFYNSTRLSRWFYGRRK